MKKILILLFLMLIIRLAFAQGSSSAVMPDPNPDRKSWEERNEQMLEKGNSSDPKIHYFDPGYLFLKIKGNVNEKLMPDYLRPNIEGDKLIFEILAPVISGLLKE